MQKESTHVVFLPKTEPNPQKRTIKTEKENVTAILHPEFGKVPKYLDTIKRTVSQEATDMERMEEEEKDRALSSAHIRLLTEEQRTELVEQLKDQWEDVNRKYQLITHHVNLDTISRIRRKENYEKLLAQLEKDVQKLSKKYVFVKVE